jgi:two-component system, cell cycle response regulator
MRVTSRGGIVSSDHKREPITQELDVIRSLPSRTEEGFALYVLRGSQAGAVYMLEQESVMLGRSQDADLKLGEEGVSRLHARFAMDSGSVSVVDLGSRNGTFVNGERISEPHGLLDGDQIAIGNVVLRFAVQPVGEIKLAHDTYEASVRDPLTSLYNRRYAELLLEEATRNDAGYRSLCMLHIDGLHEINERQGRTVGDELLRAVAKKLHGVFGVEDMIARWDGAQLLIISREPELEALGAQLRAIVAAAEVPGAQGPVGTTASAGVTGITPGSESAQVLGMAEQALSEALRAGGDRVSVHADIPIDISAEIAGYTAPFDTRVISSRLPPR